MFKPYGQVDPSLQYGYGWFLASRFRMHGGGTPGFLSRIRRYPEQKVSIILLFNSDHMDPETILARLNHFSLGETMLHCSTIMTTVCLASSRKYGQQHEAQRVV